MQLVLHGTEWPIRFDSNRVRVTPGSRRENRIRKTRKVFTLTPPVRCDSVAKKEIISMQVPFTLNRHQPSYRSRGLVCSILVIAQTTLHCTESVEYIIYWQPKTKTKKLLDYNSIQEVKITSNVLVPDHLPVIPPSIQGQKLRI